MGGPGTWGLSQGSPGSVGCHPSRDLPLGPVARVDGTGPGSEGHHHYPPPGWSVNAGGPGPGVRPRGPGSRGLVATEDRGGCQRGGSPLALPDLRVLPQPGEDILDRVHQAGHRPAPRIVADLQRLAEEPAYVGYELLRGTRLRLRYRQAPEMSVSMPTTTSSSSRCQ